MAADFGGMIAFDDAMKIAGRFSQELAEKYRDKIAAVFAIGSLGSDYYRPGQSDIDTVVITTYSRGELAQIEAVVSSIADRYRKEYRVPKGFGAIVLAEEQLFPPYIMAEELVLEILRLKTQSKSIYGNYDTARIPYPDKQAIIDDAKAFQTWVDAERLKSNAERHFSIPLKMDAVSVVNSMLIALKRYLLIHHGIVEFNKFKVVGLYLANDPPIVNGEAFALIDALLHNAEMHADEDTLERITAFNDELYRVVNKIVFGGQWA